jgi:hypothetical protein
MSYAQSRALATQEDSIRPGDRIVAIDDVIASGETAFAAIKLIERAKGLCIGVACLAGFPNWGLRRIAGFGISGPFDRALVRARVVTPRGKTRHIAPVRNSLPSAWFSHHPRDGSSPSIRAVRIQRHGVCRSSSLIRPLPNQMSGIQQLLERVSFTPTSRPTASSIDHLSSANCRHLANLP